MRSSIMQEKQALTRIQKEILEGILTLTMEDGCPPISSRVKEFFGRDVRGPLDELKAARYIHQPYARGALVPVLDAQGKPLRLTILPNDIADKAEAEAYRRKR